MKRQSTDVVDKTVRIGCSSAFWGDTETAAEQLVTRGHIDYLVSDYLAEITLSIMAGQQLKNPEAGYAADFVKTIEPLLKPIKQNSIKVLSNAGGINPLACRTALQQAAKAAGVKMKIAVVLGDDITALSDELRRTAVKEMYSGVPFPDASLSVNAYLGASGIVAALQAGADIVITGRVADSALVLAPLIYEFHWAFSDFDKLAQGSLAGHIIECGAQCTGGNFTDWRRVADGYADMGFPIVEVSADGSFVVSKPDNTGGLVTIATVAEQLVYEIGDPRTYCLPDVVCDFTQVSLQQLGEDKVTVSGAKGRAPTSDYKVSVTYLDGYRCSVTFLLAGLEAKSKGQAVATALLEKTAAMFVKKGFAAYTATHIELLGTEATYGEHAASQSWREVSVRITVAHPEKKALVLFSREIAQASTGMAPGITGIVGGRPKVTPKICLFSCLIDKAHIQVELDLDGICKTIALDTVSHTESTNLVEPNIDNEQPSKQTSDLPTAGAVPLVKLAYARSGDKGNHANIGVIARKQSYLPYILQALSEDAVACYMGHVLDVETGKVTRWQLPGFHAINFLLENSLGGGGVASLRVDPQGKALAQQLLEIEIPVSQDIIDELA